MYTITKKFSFSASHQLTGLPPDHKCGRLHGHNYDVEVEAVASELDDTGFVVEFDRLAPVKRYLDDHFDHRTLNDVMDGQPSSERLARHVYVWCVANLDPSIAKCLRAVTVRETDSTSATYAAPEAAGRT